MTKLFRLSPDGPGGLSPCSFVPASDVLDGFAQPAEQGAVLLADGDTTAGIWEATPYAERMNDFGVNEMAVIISGRVRITPDDGVPQTFGPGETYVMAKGFRGTFEVLETLRKYYFIA